MKLLLVACTALLFAAVAVAYVVNGTGNEPYEVDGGDYNDVDYGVTDGPDYEEDYDGTDYGETDGRGPDYEEDYDGTEYGAETDGPDYYEQDQGPDGVYETGNSTATETYKKCKPAYVMPETTCCGECKPGYPGSFGQYWLPM